MKKILIVSLFGMDAFGGVERVVYYLNDILKENFNVDVCSIERSPRKFDAIICPFIKSIKVFFQKKDLVITQGWHIWPYRADIVIAHGTTAGYLRQIQSEKSIITQYISFMEKQALRRAKRVWAVSESCKNELINILNIQEKKIKVLNNFVDEHSFFPLNDNESSCGKLIILYSGRLIKRKGVDNLLKLADAVKDKSNIELHIASNDSTNINIFRNIKNTKIFIGLSISEMNKFYNNGDVLYFPTRYEGFSMVTLEALSCGLPIIGSRYAIPIEIGKKDYAIIYDNDDPNEIIGIASKLKVKYQTRRQQIHTETITQFGKNRYVQALIEELKYVFKCNNK